MIGYVKNNLDFYRGDFLEYDIKRAVAYSGGNGQHYELFKHLFTHSLFDNTMGMALYDTRAGQSLLYTFPIGLRIFMSLILYKEELNILDQYKANDITNSIAHPIDSVYMSTIVIPRFISKRLYNTVREFDEDIILNDEHLYTLKVLLDITDTLNFNFRDLKTNMKRALNVFNIDNGSYETYIDITINNDRYAAIAALTRQLNYRTKSRNILMRATERWLTQTSSI